MLVMAIEAAKQTADYDRRITGYRFKDVSFCKALKVTLEPNGVDTQFYLRPLSNTSSKSSIWHEFRLCVLEDGDWAENFRGCICVEYEIDISETYQEKEFENEAQSHRQRLRNCVNRCQKTVAPKNFYETLQGCGYGFGSEFQLLQQISYGDHNEATATIQPSRQPVDGDAIYSQPYVVHPTTLDAIMQLILSAVSKGSSEGIPTLIPTRIQKLWVANSGLFWPDASEMIGCAEAVFKGYREVESSVVALDKIDGEIRASIEGFECTVVSRQGESPLPETNQRQLCYRIDWKPDLDLLHRDQIRTYCEASRPVQVQPLEFCQDLEFLCFLFISKATAALENERPFKMKAHMYKYVEWMHFKIAEFHAEKLPISHPEWQDRLNDEKYQNELFERLENTNVQGHFYVEMSKSLMDILYGRVDALELLFQNDLVSEFYLDAEGPNNCYNALATYLDALGHKNPGMEILEIGAGTGGATKPVLDTLMIHGEKELGAPRYKHYDFTDISPSFFEKAQELFNSQKDRMTFARLNIEEDPIRQGFKSEKYDLIIASNVSEWYWSFRATSLMLELIGNPCYEGPE